jgi:hypothetical protein
MGTSLSLSAAISEASLRSDIISQYFSSAWDPAYIQCERPRELGVSAHYRYRRSQRRESATRRVGVSSSSAFPPAGADGRFLTNPMISWSGEECLLRGEPHGSPRVRQMPVYGAQAQSDKQQGSYLGRVGWRPARMRGLRPSSGFARPGIGQTAVLDASCLRATRFTVARAARLGDLGPATSRNLANVGLEAATVTRPTTNTT